MLLDIWSVLGGIGLAAVAFIVVILVCVVILRLLAAILPSYEDRTTRAAAAGHGVPEDSSAEAPEPLVEQEAGALDGEDDAPGDGAKQAPAPDEAAPI